MELLKAIILAVVNAILQALPSALNDKARKVDETEEDKDTRKRIVEALRDFEGVDFDALESS